MKKRKIIGLQKNTFGTMEAGNISAFYPRTWEGCTIMTEDKYDWLIAKIEESKYKTACKKEDE